MVPMDCLDDHHSQATSAMKKTQKTLTIGSTTFMDLCTFSTHPHQKRDQQNYSVHSCKNRLHNARLTLWTPIEKITLSSTDKSHTRKQQCRLINGWKWRTTGLTASSDLTT